MTKTDVAVGMMENTLVSSVHKNNHRNYTDIIKIRCLYLKLMKDT